MSRKEKTTEAKTAGQERRILKKQRLTMLVDYVLSNTDDPELVAAAKALKPGNRVARVGLKDVISEQFSEVGDQFGEDRIWEDYKLGRREMRSITNNLIKKAKPAERKWINFNSEDGIYTLMGTGSAPPNGWTGYVPAKLEDIEVV